MAKISPNLEAFSNRKDLVFVVDCFNAIEEHLAAILTREVGAPKDREHFVRSILFNNAIVSFASKVKLFLHLRAVNSWPDIDPKDFHRLMHIRNQFAHCNPKHHIHIILDKEEKRPAKVEQKLMLESLSSVGKFVPVEISIALQEFTEIYVRLDKYLLEISKVA